MIVAHIARKPITGSISGNVRKIGTGAINIDGCRIGADEMKVTRSNGVNISTNRSMAAANTGRVDMGTKTGRWPANVLLEHRQSCKVTGTREVKGGAGTYCCYWPEPCPGHVTDRSLAGLTRHGSPPPGWTPPSREQTIAAWTCESGCPIADMDQQSGLSTTPETVTRGKGSLQSTNVMTSRGRQEGVACHGDSGGASRFFKHFGGTE